MDVEELQHLEKILAAHQRRLQVLEHQAARYGIATPAEMQIEIDDLSKIIADTERFIQRSVDQDPDLIRAAPQLVKDLIGLVEEHVVPFDLRLRIARLGGRKHDWRPGVCTLEPIWCGPFPSGVYHLQERGSVEVEEFYVARYPITVGQYAQFYENKGYENSNWWTPNGWEWLQPHGVHERHGRRGRITAPAEWDNIAFRNANYPIVNVSWYEASAFCRWLTAQGRDQIRLPSEVEWEIAAAWDSGIGIFRQWAEPEEECWQNIARTTSFHKIVFDEDEDDIAPHTIVPVGMFPQGASPCGALDMAGNVWEWCSSLVENRGTSPEMMPDFAPIDDTNEDTDTNERKMLVVRGGAWNINDYSRGWRARRKNIPNGRHHDTGFRVIKSSVTGF